ncbi:unnamed protein product [Effrenium voratum]|nr:unnamed protein product [Effrenium voratum]
MPIEEVTGDLLTAQEQYIVQQSNCATTYAAGLAAAISSSFPHADVYAPDRRRERGSEKGDVPGTIAVCGGPCASQDQEKRGVINVFAQFRPGKPSRKEGPVEYKGLVSSPDVVDDERQRLEWFKAGLQRIAELPVESIAFPYQIGCGLAGGRWPSYLEALEEFAAKVEPQGVKVKIYKMEEAAKPCTDCKQLVAPGTGRTWRSKQYCKGCYDKY